MTELQDNNQIKRVTFNENLLNVLNLSDYSIERFLAQRNSLQQPSGNMDKPKVITKKELFDDAVRNNDYFTKLWNAQSKHTPERGTVDPLQVLKDDHPKSEDSLAYSIVYFKTLLSYAIQHSDIYTLIAALDGCTTIHGYQALFGSIVHSLVQETVDYSVFSPDEESIEYFVNKEPAQEDSIVIRFLLEMEQLASLRSSKLFPDPTSIVAFRIGYSYQNKNNPEAALDWLKDSLKYNSERVSQKNADAIDFQYGVLLLFEQCARETVGRLQLAYDAINSCIQGRSVGLFSEEAFSDISIPAIPNEEMSDNMKICMETAFRDSSLIAKLIGDTYDYGTFAKQAFLKIARNHIDSAIKYDPMDPQLCMLKNIYLNDISLTACIGEKEIDPCTINDTRITTMTDFQGTPDPGSFFLLYSSYIRSIIFGILFKNTSVKSLFDNPLRQNSTIQSILSLIENQVFSADETDSALMDWYLGTDKNNNNAAILILSICIRTIAETIKEYLCRNEYSSYTYHTRGADNEGTQDSAFKHNTERKIAYYTSLETAKFLFDPMYKDADKDDLAPMTEAEIKAAKDRKLPEDEYQTVNFGEGKNCLTIMHAKYMNDPNEGFPLLSSLGYSRRERTQFMNRILDNRFLFLKSFTETIDSLPMWNRYGSNRSDGLDSNGCCVILNPNTFSQLTEAFFSNEEGTRQLRKIGDDFHLYQIVYLNDGKIDPKDNEELFVPTDTGFNKGQMVQRYFNALIDFTAELRAQVKEQNDAALEKIINSYMANVLTYITFLFKDREYADEKESRLIIIRSPEQSKLIRQLKTDPVKLCVNPYFHVFVDKIILGPKVEKSDEWIPYLQYELNKLRRPMGDTPLFPTEVKVRKSKIHYR